MQKITGTYDYSSGTALDVKVLDEYDSFLTKVTSEDKHIYIGGTYNGEDFHFNILFDGATKN
ncbi:hypothetical protein LRR81_10025 [Metabacillus sp. GX 13764]|uniref:hypothetical protein n=1 Tax=Metabacillus kandeliae TaxID=2900151 RepID=UPI001E56C19A|nr:hypothetical protein [Metabacillus kandeliae]MCD7034577.1 hypothetical protein [Metabacillus kandeliae]